LGLILTFAPIGMLDSGWTLALNSKCKGGLTDNSLFPHTKEGRPANDPSYLQLLFSKRNLPRESISQLNWIPIPPCSKPSSWQVESGNSSCWWGNAWQVPALASPLIDEQTTNGYQGGYQAS
jgi:hypothetical protein